MRLALVQLLLSAAIGPLVSTGIGGVSPRGCLACAPWWPMLSVIGSAALVSACVLLVARQPRLIVPVNGRSGLNPALILTWLRAAMVVPTAQMVLLNDHLGAPPWLVLGISTVFLTDLADGILARRAGYATGLGGVLDSTTDYLLLGSIGIALLAIRRIAPWLALVLAARLLLQGMFALLLLVLRRHTSRPSPMGKAFVAVLMTSAALGALIPRAPQLLGLVAAFLLAALALLSGLEKLVLFVRALRSAEPMSG